MSNFEGFTLNHLLQQMYGKTDVDEDVDVELSDEELELIAGGGWGQSYFSDLEYNGKTIVKLEKLKKISGEWDQIHYIKQLFNNNGIRMSDQGAQVIWNHTREENVRLLKREYRGLEFETETGQIKYIPR